MISGATSENHSFYVIDDQWLYVGVTDRGHYFTTLLAMRDRNGVCFPLMDYEWLTQEFVDAAFALFPSRTGVKQRG